VTIDPALAERIRAVLRRRADSWAATDAHMREIFGDDWHSTKTFPTELCELSPDALAELTVNVLWPPAPASQEERPARAREAMARIYAEVMAEAPEAVNADG
jgi:hypothetical protein